MSKDKKNRKKAGQRGQGIHVPEIGGRDSEKSMSSEEQTFEEYAKEATLAPQQEKPKRAKKPKMSLMEKILNGMGYVKAPKFEDRYISRQEIDKGYISREEVAKDYLPNSEVERLYISFDNVQSLYVLKSEVDQLYISSENVKNDYVLNSTIYTLIDKLKDILEMGEDFANLSLEDKFAHIQQRIEELKTTVENSSVKILDSIADESDNSDVFSELRKGLDSLGKQKKEIQIEKNRLEEDNAKLKAALVALKKKGMTQLLLKIEFEGKLKELNDKLEAAQSETIEINKEKNKAEERATRAESKIKDAEDKACAAEQAVQEAKADAQSAREELANSEVGKLNDTISKLTTQLEESKRNYDDAQAEAAHALEDANAKISTLESTIEKKTSEIGDKDQQIATKAKEIEEAKKLELLLNTQVQNMESEIEQLKKQGEIDRTEIESKTTELAKANDSIKKQHEEITEKESTITSLEKECADKSAEISMLNDGISTLEGEKLKLTKEKEVADAATKVKADFIKSERDNFAAKMMKIVDELCEVAKADFIVSCDEESERQCKTLAEKVWRPLIDLKEELIEADKVEADTMDKLEEAWHKVIKSHLDEPSELTRIAQWYAYSLVPFMGDAERCEGIRVNRPKMKAIYALASELLSMVGMRFDLPILYVENLEDDSDYDNVTGQRQLNIEYMCPTARNHKEKIDISDTESVIIDVVEVGYADNKGNKKNSQIII